MLDGFAGVRIVELAQFVFVPSGGALLADHGAEVVHVEMVDSGDPYRSLNIGDGREPAVANLSMEQNNRFDVDVAQGVSVRLAAGPVGFDGRYAPPRRCVRHIWASTPTQSWLAQASQTRRWRSFVTPPRSARMARAAERRHV